MYLNILLCRLQILQMNIFSCVTLYLTCRAKSCDPQKYSGATHNIIYAIGTNCIYYYILYMNLHHMRKYNMYYRPDMG